MSQDVLAAAVTSICRGLSELDFNSADLLDQVRRRWPADGDEMALVTNHMTTGIGAGWLCDRENGPLRFSRVLKPSEDSAGFSCDAVWMPDCSGPAHTHPNGELSWCVALDGTPQFDGFDAGWAFLPPGSSHTPTVAGGTMVIIYFLPNGAVEWK